MKTKIKFDFEMVMGVVEYTRSLRFGGQKFSRALIVEKAIEKTSENLVYVGLNDTLGHDFTTKVNEEVWRLEAKVLIIYFKLIKPPTLKKLLLKIFKEK